jgi:hypothetical protein
MQSKGEESNRMKMNELQHSYSRWKYKIDWKNIGRWSRGYHNWNGRLVKMKIRIDSLRIWFKMKNSSKIKTA